MDMYSASQQFGGGAFGFGGGGFNPSSTQNPDSSSSPIKSRDSQPMLPLTVKQMYQAGESSKDMPNVVVDGVNMHNVKVVGMVINKVETNTTVSFVIDDGTGRIECSKWMGDDSEGIELNDIVKGMYVRVHGNLSNTGKKQINIFAIRPVTDYNEIAHHFVECIYVHLHNIQSQGQQGAVSAPAYMANSAVRTPSKGNQAAPTAQFSEHHRSDNLMSIEHRVSAVLRSSHCQGKEHGLHREEIANMLNCPVEKISEALRVLEGDGMAYNTIDDDHFSSAGDML